MTQSKIMSFATYKGGVGKTTLSAFIAASLARGIGNNGQPYRVLFVDMDPQANGSLIFNRDMVFDYLNNGVEYPNMYHVLTGKSSMQDIISTVFLEENKRLNLPSVPIDLAPANEQMREAPQILLGKPGADLRLLKALKAISGKYDFIICDSPPGDSFFSLNVLSASDEVVIPLNPGTFEYDAVENTLFAISEINEFRDTPINVAGILPNKFKRNDHSSSETYALIKVEYPGLILPIIPEMSAIKRCVNAGVDPAAYATDQRSLPMFEAFARVCEELTHG